VRRLCGVAVVAALGWALAGCSGTTGGVGGNQAVGTGAGAAAGGILGNQIGDGEGRAVATTIGVIAGGLIGSRLGAALDEQDRRRAMQAEYNALEFGRSGAPVTWQNPDSGRYGEVVPEAPYRVASADCRDYTHTIYIDGQPQVARGTACRQPDGSWRPTN